MAEVPYINPSRPIWPARPNEKPVRRKHPTEDERDDQQSNEKKSHKEDDNHKEPGEGHLDEYV